MGFILRDDQLEAVARFEALYSQFPQGKALIVAPTGWGKTVAFGHIAQDFRQKGKRVLVIAHRDELVTQATDKIHRFDPSIIIGKVGSGVEEWGGEVTVAMVDTIVRPKRLQQLCEQHFDLVIWDEAHHCRANKYMKVRLGLDEKEEVRPFHLGVTATPARLDGKALAPLFGTPAIFEMTILDAMMKDLVCQAEGMAIQTHESLDSVSSAKNADGEKDFRVNELGEIVDTPARNSLIVRKYQEYAEGVPAVVFCVTIAHAEHLAQAFRDAGITCECITGESKDRKDILQRFHDGVTQVLTNVLVLTEGWDEPRAKCAIMARPTQSASLYIQCIGRVLRLFEDKIAIILDITDNYSRFPLVSLKSVFNLKGNSRPNETIREALEREQKEEKERLEKIREREEEIRLARERKLREKREQDEKINFLADTWRSNERGVYVREAGTAKHRFGLFPVGDGNYDIFLRRAPRFDHAIKLLSRIPLESAMHHCDKLAVKLAKDPGAINYIDRSSMRDAPATADQLDLLARIHIPHDATITKARAGELIDLYNIRRDAERRLKKQREALNA